MVALGVVLGDEFPVRRHVIGQRPSGPQVAEVEPTEVGIEVPELARERRGLRIEIEEDEALPRVAAHLDQAVTLER